jgi:hypothetical protein
MTTMRRLPLSVVLVLAGSALAAPALASDTSQLRSGVVASIDMTTHRLRLEEMGPWGGEGTKPVTRSIEFGPATKFELVARARGANPQGWIGGYVESALAPAAVRPGDFATVTLERNHSSPEAGIVQIVRPAGTKG